jgi:type IV prepilin leader peptidase
LPVLIFMAALVGLVGALIARVGKGQYFAFGPSLAVAGWIILVANAPITQLVQWWLIQSGFR